MSFKSIIHNCHLNEDRQIPGPSISKAHFLTSKVLLISACLLALGACAPSQPDKVQLPFKLTGKGIGTSADPQPPCDNGFTATGNTAQGTGTYLGRFSSVHRQCVNFETLEFRDGTVTYHAANGDQLHATFEGFLSPTTEPGVLSFDNPATPAGGTGRFTGAEGEFRARGLVNLNDNTFELSVEGYLLLPK